MTDLLAQLEKKIFKCEKCKRLRSITPTPMPHIFYAELENLEIFCVARNPGIEHDYSQVSRQEFMDIYKDRWWISRFGRYLRKQLSDDVVKRKVFFTNVCKCSSPQNSALLLQEIASCSSFLEMQIQLMHPRVILAFGADAHQALVSRTVKGKYDGIKTFFLYHPAYFNHGGNSFYAHWQANVLRQVKEKYDS